jgi:hypothetical protein
MCALAGVDPCGVINAGPVDRELLIEVAAMVHKLTDEANRRASRA